MGERRQQRLDLRAHAAREYRGMTRGAHRDEDRRPVDDGGENEGRELRLIDDVHGYVVRLCCLGHRAVHRRIIRRSDDRDGTAEMRRSEGGGDVAQLPARRLRGELQVQGRGDDAHPCTGFPQGAHLAKRDGSATHHHRGLVLQAQEDGQIVHGSVRPAHAGTASAVPRAGTGEAAGCSPHSRDPARSHHQRPARRLSPGCMARVHGEQPMLGN